MLPLLGRIVNRRENGRQPIVVNSSVCLDLAAFGQHFEQAKQAGQLTAQSRARRFAAPMTQRFFCYV